MKCCEKCGRATRGAIGATVVQIAMWIGWGAFGGGTWVLVGELIKRFVVKA